MSQILNIFQKDARHHWPEILVSIALLITFVAEQPHKWTAQAYSIRLLDGLVSALPVVMILSWAFLIIRLVQSESLVGNRQFWITRPYEWHKLLAAKLFSIFVFIHLPLFVSQLVLLAMARFPVVSSIPGLVFVHSMFFMAMVVPSLTVGVITSGIGQAAIVVLCGFLILLGLIAIMFRFPDMDFATDSTDWLQGTIYLGASSSVIFLQYLYRRTLLARFVVGGAIVLIALVILLAPYKRIINNWFPLPDNAHPMPIHLKLDRTVTFAHTEDWSPSKYEDDVELEIPLELADLDVRTLIQIRAIKLDIDLPDGKPWTSHWHSVFNQTISSGRVRVWPDIQMKKAVFASVKNSHVKAHVTLGLNAYKLGGSTQVLIAESKVSIPGGARCMNDLSESLLHCFSALKAPVPVYVVAELPSAECPVENDAAREPWAPSRAFFADLDIGSTPDLDLTPIQQFDINLSRYFIQEDHQVRLPVCSGTRLVFTNPRFLYSVREEIDLGEIALADYHPTFPRRIIPPAQRPPKTPSDSLSYNISPEVVPSKAKVAAD